MNATFDGKPIEYTSSTVFEVQVGKGRGRYNTRIAFVGEFARAAWHYNMINIGNGYKKRLQMSGRTLVSYKSL